jgi:hypothetical protein
MHKILAARPEVLVAYTMSFDVHHLLHALSPQPADLRRLRDPLCLPV